MTNKLFDITTPAFAGHNVRTVTDNGQTWFCAKDMVSALGIAVSNLSTQLTRLNITASERRLIKPTDVTYQNLIGETLHPRGTNFISATAVRRIAQRSTKPAARAFQDFLNGTVAEAIETDGAYVHPALAQQNPDIATMLAEMLS